MSQATKRCAMCKRAQQLVEFNRRCRSGDGLQAHCRECNREASRAYYRRSRAKHLRDVARHKRAYVARNRSILLAHLLEHPCVDCGESDPRVLEFDHVRGVKRGDVGSMAANAVSVAGLLGEIAKCEVRCVNCHLRRSGEAQRWWRARVPPR